MAISLSAVLLFGALMFLVIKMGRTSILGAVVCALFGFYLAASGAGPAVSSTMGALASAIGNINV